MGKICTKCRAAKDYSDFSKSKKTKDGLSVWCKQCHTQYYVNNKEKILARQKIKYKIDMQNPIEREKRRERCTRARLNNPKSTRKAVAAWKKNNRECANTHDEIEKLISANNNKCYYCKCTLYNYHVDHMTPLCRGGANTIDNLAVTCAKCNLQKGAKTAKEFENWRLTWASC